jgi:cytochrome P450
VISRYDDVYAALHDWETFSSARGVFPTSEPGAQGMDMADTLMPMMIRMDPPRHTALRKLVSRGFTPRRIAALEPAVAAIATELLDSLSEQTEGGGSCDVVREFAGPLPAIVIADLLGLPREDRTKFREWSSVLAQGDPTATENRSAALAAAGSLYEYFGNIIEQRRQRPGEDLVSALVQAEVDGEKLSDAELLGFCLLLLIAGHETTTNLLGNATAQLASHPEQRALLADDERLLPNAVEELLRYDSPVQGLSRTLTRDIVMHGQSMLANQTVLLLFGSANRDEQAFPDPDRLDVTRQQDRQVALGHGVHFCLGAPLARLEARIALSLMLSRMPGWELDPTAPATRMRSGPIRGYASLPIRWANTTERLPA